MRNVSQNAIETNNITSNGKELLNALAGAFNTEVLHNTIELPSAAGIGGIRLVESASGLSMLLIHLELKSDTKIRLPRDSSVGSTNALQVFGILTPRYFSINQNENVDHAAGVMFSSGDVELEFVFKSGVPVKAVCLILSDTWLKNECKEIETDLLFMIPRLLCKRKPRAFMDSANHSILQTIIALHNYASSNHPNAFYLKAKAISILSDILTGFDHEDGHLTDADDLTCARMRTIEKILEQHLYNNLPSISSIARQVVLSESTLKRNFKQVYGVSIYEFYLQKKMQLARQMLDEKPIAVKEVGYMLGYETTSNFIKAFKKYYESSPGVFKKKFN